MDFGIRSTILAASALFAFCWGAAPALAQDIIPRKPGLWRITMNMAGAPAGMPPITMCLDSKTDANMQQMAQSGEKPDCSKNEVKRSGNQMTMDSVCKIDNSVSTSHGVITFSGDTAYHMDMTTRFNPPMAGQAEHKMSQDAAWTGPCPAGINPGDMVLPNGMKMNMGTMGKPPARP
jgi:hypothetical protein